MTYNTIADMKDSPSLYRRLVASAAQEGKTVPEDWVATRAWQIVSSPGWEAAWISATLNGVDDPGSREDVVTDGMILAVIQPMP